MSAARSRGRVAPKIKIARALVSSATLLKDMTRVDSLLVEEDMAHDEEAIISTGGECRSFSDEEEDV